MRLEILQVPDCPGAAILETRLPPLLAARPGIDIIWQIVTSQDQAQRLGMTGSPTLLIDGADPFARPGQQPAFACRRYPNDDGLPAPAPTDTQLREALQLP